MKPIGILGGTFDPVHIGHLRLAIELHAALDLAEVRFVPIHTHPFGKTPVATAAQRAEMLALALADLPQCRIDRRELQRGDVSYTVETLESLHAEVEPAPLCLFLGLDAFRQLDGWHRWDELLEFAHLVVVDRPDMNTEPSARHSAGLHDRDDFNATIRTLLSKHGVDSADALRDKRTSHILRQAIPGLDISATYIRDAVARDHSIRYLVPDRVLDYIRKRQLYYSDA